MDINKQTKNGRIARKEGRKEEKKRGRNKENKDKRKEKIMKNK
jgi:hypothetical protein